MGAGNSYRWSLGSSHQWEQDTHRRLQVCMSASRVDEKKSGLKHQGHQSSLAGRVGIGKHPMAGPQGTR